MEFCLFFRSNQPHFYITMEEIHGAIRKIGCLKTRCHFWLSICLEAMPVGSCKVESQRCIFLCFLDPCRIWQIQSQQFDNCHLRAICLQVLYLDGRCSDWPIPWSHWRYPSQSIWLVSLAACRVFSDGLPGLPHHNIQWQCSSYWQSYRHSHSEWCWGVSTSLLWRSRNVAFSVPWRPKVPSDRRPWWPRCSLAHNVNLPFSSCIPRKTTLL